MSTTSAHDMGPDRTEAAGSGPNTDTTGRRALLAKGSAVAAVAAVAGLSSQRAYAADGDTMHVGESDTGTLTTKLSGGSTFWVENGDSAGSASLYGSQTGTDADYGVHGLHAGSSGVGVYGEATGSGGRGVYGEATGSSGTGVFGSGTSYDVEAGGGGRVRFTASGNSGSATDDGRTGTIARDSAGNLWYCYASDRWRRLGGPDTAGAFHPIEPTRAYDSRQALPEQGLLADGENRVVSVADGRDINGGAITDPDVVPAGATAIAYNLTIAGTVGAGFLSITPGDAADFKASSINWTSSGLDIANAGIVKLDDSRQVKVFCGGGSTNFIVDITGYYI